MPDLEKLRTFGLIASLLLISYTAAGIELEAGTRATFLGIPFVVQSPNLLPFGLFLLSTYCLARFFYYGMMLSDSPYRTRKNLLNKLFVEGKSKISSNSIYMGPNKFSTPTLRSDRETLEAEMTELKKVFPKVGRYQLEYKLVAHQFANEDGGTDVSWDAEISIPAHCKLAALIQDIDYTAPIWSNMFALGTAGFRILM